MSTKWVNFPIAFQAILPVALRHTVPAAGSLDQSATDLVSSPSYSFARLQPQPPLRIKGCRKLFRLLHVEVLNSRLCKENFILQGYMCLLIYYIRYLSANVYVSMPCGNGKTFTWRGTEKVTEEVKSTKEEDGYHHQLVHAQKQGAS